jgi:hypothetical protein
MEEMMLLDRRTFAAGYGAFMAMLAIRPLHAAGEPQRISGGKLKWQAQLPGTWWGGSAAAIERVMRTTSSEQLRDIMRKMLPQAKNLDAYFINPDVTGTTSQALSSIEANVLNLRQIDLSDLDTRKELWKQMSEKLAKDGPEGTQTALQGEGNTTTGGAAAYSAVFINKVREGGSYNEQVHLVDRSQGQWHYLKLKADANKYRARAQEFNQMLGSIKYE